MQFGVIYMGVDKERNIFISFYSLKGREKQLKRETNQKRKRKEKKRRQKEIINRKEKMSEKANKTQASHMKGNICHVC